jgi:hypothetical protein
MNSTNPLHPEGNPPKPGPTVHMAEPLQRTQSAPLILDRITNANAAGTIPAPGIANNPYTPTSQNITPGTASPFVWPGMNSGGSGYFALPNNGENQKRLNINMIDLDAYRISVRNTEHSNPWWTYLCSEPPDGI